MQAKFRTLADDKKLPAAVQQKNKIRLSRNNKLESYKDKAQSMSSNQLHEQAPNEQQQFNSRMGVPMNKQSRSYTDYYLEEH